MIAVETAQTCILVWY